MTPTDRYEEIKQGLYQAYLDGNPESWAYWVEQLDNYLEGFV